MAALGTAAGPSRPKAGVMGGRIKEARQRLGLSQHELALQLGVTAAAVAQWETRANDPRGERLNRLCRVLDVPSDWLLGKAAPSTGPALGASHQDGSASQVQRARDLGEEALRLGVDLERIVAEARQRRWLEENREALEDANAFLDKHGLWSDGKRLF